MKYQSAERFRADYKKLKPREKQLFRQAVRDINAAYAARGPRVLPDWPAHLRIGPLARDRTIMEMTWSFTAPDGRATFQFVPDGDELIVVWRRIGDHRIFKEP